MRRNTPARLAIAIALAATPLVSAFAQNAGNVAPQGAAKPADPGSKKVLGLADIGRWNRIGNAALSADGKWMTYVITPNEGDGTLYVRQLDGSQDATRFPSDRRQCSPTIRATSAISSARRARARGEAARAAVVVGRPWVRRRRRSAPTLRGARSDDGRQVLPHPGRARRSNSLKARASLPFARTRRMSPQSTTAPT